MENVCDAAVKMFVLQRTFEFRMNSDQNVKEDVSADVKDNYVMYHLNDDDSEVSVIEDFNRVSTIYVLITVRYSF